MTQEEEPRPYRPGMRCGQEVSDYNIAYLCRLPFYHKGPHYVQELEWARTRREQWEKDNIGDADYFIVKHPVTGKVLLDYIKASDAVPTPVNPLVTELPESMLRKVEWDDSEEDDLKSLSVNTGQYKLGFDIHLNDALNELERTLGESRHKVTRDKLRVLFTDLAKDLESWKYQ